MGMALIALVCRPPSARDYAQSGDVMRRFLLTMATAASALTATACSDLTGVGGNIAGTYELRTINGQSLPVSTQSGQTTEAAVLEVRNDGTFIHIVQYRTFGIPLIQEDEFSGTWEQNGSEIRFESDDGEVFFADRTSTNRIVVEDNDGNLWAYQRF
jgi:hypothetical protein